MCRCWAQLCESPRLWWKVVVSPDVLRGGSLRRLNVMPWLRKRLAAMKYLKLNKRRVGASLPYLVNAACLR